MTIVPINLQSWTVVSIGPATIYPVAGTVQFLSSFSTPPATAVGVSIVAGQAYYFSGLGRLFAKAAAGNNTPQIIVSSGATGITGESWAARFRRLAGTARWNNPVEQPLPMQLVGSVPWKISTAYVAGATPSVVSNGGKVYQCITAGTSAGAGGPAGFAADITDNTAHWAYTGFQSAPSIGAWSASHNGAYSVSKTWTAVDNTGVMRFRGGVPVSSFGGGVTVSVDVSPATGNLSVVSNGYSGYWSAVEFELEGDSFEANFLDSGGNLNIVLDGKYADSTTAFPNLGGSRYTIIDFSNVQALNGPNLGTGFQRHKVRLEWTVPCAIVEINIKPTAKLFYPEQGDNFSVGFVGDSQLVGVNMPNISSTFGIQLMHLLGLPDMMLCGIGGAGVVVAGASTPYIGHAIADLQRLDAFRPLGLIINQASQNDTGQSTVQTAAGILLAAQRAAFPLVPIFVLGVFASSSGGGFAALVTVENAWAAAVAAMQAAGDSMIFFIPAATDPTGSWLSGTGNTGAPAGNGNADFDLGPDAVHISSAGAALWARNLRASFMKQIANIP